MTTLLLHFVSKMLGRGTCSIELHSPPSSGTVRLQFASPGAPHVLFVIHPDSAAAFSIPSAMSPEQLARMAIAQLHKELAYLPVGEESGASEPVSMSLDLRMTPWMGDLTPAAAPGATDGFRHRPPARPRTMSRWAAKFR
jgi:hypothetical protein